MRKINIAQAINGFIRFIEYRSYLVMSGFITYFGRLVGDKRHIDNIKWEIRLAYRKDKLKGLLNYFLNLVDAGLRLPLCIAKPVIFNIEVVEGICNFSCKTCSSAAQGRKKEISFEEFKKIFDLHKYTVELRLFARGEPFMIRDIFKIIAYAKSRNCAVGTMTNMSIVNESMARKIIESQIDWLGISLDAAEPELFERIRLGSRFETIVNNIKTLNDLKKEYRSINPDLFFIVTAMKENIQEMPKIVELAGQLNIKQVMVNALRVGGGGLAVEEQSLTNFPSLTQDIMAAAEKRAEELGIKFICPDHRRHNNPCSYPWRTLNTLMDGTVIPCCSYYPALGNIFTDGIKGVWNNKNFRLIRKTARKENSICHFCIQALDKRSSE